LVQMDLPAFLIIVTTGHISLMFLLPSSPHPDSLAMSSANTCSPLSNRSLPPPLNPL
jgi:hypothetical protein